MKYSDYKRFSETSTSKISGHNLLFWNLWCMSFLFNNVTINMLSHINKRVFLLLKNLYENLWKLYEKQIDINTFLNMEEIDHLVNIEDEFYDDLDEFEINDVVLRELISGIENIVLDLKEDKIISYNASELPINLIDVIIEGISIDNDNNNSIFINEVNAQQQLVNELISVNKSYTIIDKDIYRK